ncbi:MAG: hypothetical protein PUE10_02835 [Bacteroidales bacterium]|nr:hypothetical protein [Bacteroidales bacterium]
MSKFWLLLLVFTLQISVRAQSMKPEDFYVSAFNVMSDMLSGRDTLSIKRAVFLAEWAYYEGKLDYQVDFCDEIDRIKDFVNLFYKVNNLKSYKTGKQMALNAYFFSPYSGNGHKPYIYDFEAFSTDENSLESQFVSNTLKTHKGQCRSLPWMYKILAKEIDADVSLAHAPRHCYIMYKDEDNITPEKWINLEVTTNQMVPTWWIKKDFEICDSAIVAGTYMTPLTDAETIASQMADLAFGYWKKFNRYDEFTYYCTSRSLEFYPMNPNAWIIRGKSLEQMIKKHLMRNGNTIDEYAAHLIRQMEETKRRLSRTYMTVETAESRDRRKKEIIEARKLIKE